MSTQTNEAPTNEFILLSARMQRLPDNAYALGSRAQQRADKFLAYFIDNKDAFLEPRARVICTGGWSAVENGETMPEDPRMREANLMAEYLEDRGVPAARIYRETESTSSVENLTKSIRAGYIDPDNYKRGARGERRLGIVTHPHHFRRVALAAGKLGFQQAALQPLVTPEQDSALREAGAYLFTWAMLFGAKGLESVEAHNARGSRLLARTAAIRPGVAA